MITVKSDVRSEEILQSRRHVLFVEGSDPEGIDPQILRVLLEDKIRVEVLGPSFHIESAARALFSHHPDYYFLIDRDHYEDEFVRKCWDEFPSPETPNLLVWRRREIENYFLDPAYLEHSSYLKVSTDRLSEQIVESCNRRLFLDVVNQVIISIRENHKRRWIELFSNPNEFGTYDEALRKLTAIAQFPERLNFVRESVGAERLQAMFHDIYVRFTGDRYPLEYGVGEWLQFIKGKKVFPQVMGSCFEVKDKNANRINGKDKLREIAKDLVKKGIDVQPQDFQDIHRIIMKRISE